MELRYDERRDEEGPRNMVAHLGRLRDLPVAVNPTGARYDAVVNLAAQAGVRYSLENPYAYIDANAASSDTGTTIVGISV